MERNPLNARYQSNHQPVRGTKRLALETTCLQRGFVYEPTADQR